MILTFPRGRFPLIPVMQLSNASYQIWSNNLLPGVYKWRDEPNRMEIWQKWQNKINLKHGRIWIAEYFCPCRTFQTDCTSCYHSSCQILRRHSGRSCCRPLSCSWGLHTTCSCRDSGNTCLPLSSTRCPAGTLGSKMWLGQMEGIPGRLKLYRVNHSLSHGDKVISHRSLEKPLGPTKRCHRGRSSYCTAVSDDFVIMREDSSGVLYLIPSIVLLKLIKRIGEQRILYTCWPGRQSVCIQFKT